MRLTGKLVCRWNDGTAFITLEGRDDRGEPMLLALAGAAPADLPPVADDGWVETLDADRYRIGDGRREWIVTARSYLHRDVSAQFYAAVPPRPPPFLRRLAWRIVLAAAASGPGRWWLEHIRR